LNVYDKLVPGGVYICFTPNQLSGPHDVSKYFDYHATGLHLKEYTLTDLVGILREVGFSRIRMLLIAKVVDAIFPVFPTIVLENFLNRLATPICRRLARHSFIRPLLGIRLIATK